jgi:rubrerythrin
MEASMFRAGEIMDIAVRIENQGVVFYTACLQSAGNAEVRDVFNFLIDKENEHIEVFRRMKTEVEDEPLPEDYPGETKSYMDSFVKNEVFHRPEDAPQNGSHMDDPYKTIDFAIDFEKRSILFYSGMKQLVRRSESQKINDVIAQEHGHIRRLLELRRNLTK